MSERNEEDRKTLTEDYCKTFDALRMVEAMNNQLICLQDRAYDLGLARGREEAAEWIEAIQSYSTALEEDAERREPQHEKDVLTIAAMDQRVEELENGLRTALGTLESDGCWCDDDAIEPCGYCNIKSIHDSLVEH